MLRSILKKIRLVLVPAALAGTAVFAGVVSSGRHQSTNDQMAAAKPPAICASRSCDEVAQGYAGARPSTTIASPNGSA